MKYNKYKIIIFLCAIIVILLNLYFHMNNNKNFDNINPYLYDFEDVESLNIENNKFIQKIVPQYNNFNKVYLYLTVQDYEQYSSYNYLPINIKLELYDSDNNLIESYKYEKVFRNGRKFYINFTFPPIENSKFKTYYLHLESFMDENDTNIDIVRRSGSSLNINGIEQEYSLIYFNSYKINKTPIYYYLLPIILSGIALYILFKIDKIKLFENKYLIISIIFTIVLLGVTATFKGHDELSHYARVYDISSGNIISKSDGKWPEINMPSELYNINFNYYNEIDKLDVYDYEEPITKVDGQYTSVYSILSYLPEVIGFKLTSLFTNNPFVLFYMTRLFNTIFCIAIMYFAIKIIPFGKKALLFIGLLPSTLSTMSIVTADGILIAAFMLFLAKILQLSYTDKQIDNKDYIVLLISGIFVTITKLVYLPLCALLILIPLHKKDKKIKKNIIILFAVYTIIAILWNVIASMNLVSGQGINLMYYLKYYLMHPFKFVQITLHTFIIIIGRLIFDLFGGINDWNGTYIQDGCIVPVLYIFLFINMIYKGESKLINRDKKILGIILVTTYLLISTVMLLVCTPPNYNTIIGIQGRYFIVFLICICLIFSNKTKDKINIDIYSYIIILLNLYYCLEVFSSYM